MSPLYGFEYFRDVDVTLAYSVGLQEWDLVVLVHLKGAYAMSKAVWPLMRSQKVSLSSLLHGVDSELIKPVLL